MLIQRSEIILLNLLDSNSDPLLTCFPGTGLPFCTRRTGWCGNNFKPIANVLTPMQTFFNHGTIPVSPRVLFLLFLKRKAVSYIQVKFPNFFVISLTLIILVTLYISLYFFPHLGAWSPNTTGDNMSQERNGHSGHTTLLRKSSGDFRVELKPKYESLCAQLSSVVPDPCVYWKCCFWCCKECVFSHLKIICHFSE